MMKYRNSKCLRCSVGVVLALIVINMFGSMIAISTGVLVLSKLWDIYELPEEVYFGAIGTLVLSSFFLSIGLITSMCGRKKAKIVLGIILLISAIQAVRVGKLVYKHCDKIVDYIGFVWRNEDLFQFRDEIEEHVKCCGYKAIDSDRCGQAINSSIINDEIVPCYNVILEHIQSHKQHLKGHTYGMGCFVFIGAALSFFAAFYFYKKHVTVEKEEEGEVNGQYENITI
ncbi:hypothetical protein TRFO_04593 [Tritrichomonas foetus]|uniref:Tetraspanin family protein n=1 Tax=Tritrichomonas foetus TaxID=1144522 RepID=A0A1J4KEQ7_9EUKA|nr:hypothetical protein TRFO_04593 [Tritrichomonas foetus]|eukprot:OHT09498.1 hypothetical protein TRFO_04593 [Tritrichomonas foetus]